jgi:hypothetical protein
MTSIGKIHLILEKPQHGRACEITLDDKIFLVYPEEGVWVVKEEGQSMAPLLELRRKKPDEEVYGEIIVWLLKNYGQPWSWD